MSEFLHINKNNIYLPFDEKRLLKEFKYYSKHIANNFPKSFANNMNYIVKYFQQDTFYKVEKELWNNPEIRNKLIVNRCKYLSKNLDELTSEEILAGFKISGIYYGYSHFNPMFINWFIHKFNCKCLYDPCGGWGHRLLGSLSLDKYIYNDLSTHTKENIDFLVKFFNLTNISTYNHNARTFIPKDDFDSMFTCPPYFNLEKYECNSFKSEIEFKDFIDDLFKIFENKTSCKVFGLVIRDDMLFGHTNYTEKHLVSKEVNNIHKKQVHTFKEYLYVFKK